MYTVELLKSVNKEIQTPPDKSISHRAVILASLCNEETIIEPFLNSEDTSATLNCMKKMGIDVKPSPSGNGLIINGVGMQLKSPKNGSELYAHESGTTIRILSGLLCGQKFSTIFNAAPALCNRPMIRIIDPLRKMGADIAGTTKVGRADLYPPLNITPVSKLKAITFNPEIASAQVKSAIMFAALYADGPTTITEPHHSRDHTERMFKAFGINIKKEGKTLTCTPVDKLQSPGRIHVPADFSSAAFFIVLGLLLPDSHLILKNVNTNPTRCGLLEVLKRMGANIEIVNPNEDCDPYADIVVKTSHLEGTTVKEDEIPLMIDEIPILCVAAAFANGETVINGVSELRVKETDRIFAMEQNLNAAGVAACSSKEGNKEKITINGGSNYKATTFNSFNDHRTAMSMAIFATLLTERSQIDGMEAISKSFPDFTNILESLSK